MRKALVTILSVVIAASTLAGCSMVATGVSTEIPTTKSTEVDWTTAEETTEDITTSEIESETSMDPVQTEQDTTMANAEPVVDENYISPELKEFLDSYEAFIDEYIEFMTKYQNADATDMITMISDYSAYVAKLADMEQNMNAYDSSTMTTAEAIYYTEVMLRCSQKLLEAAQ